jgi:hypothetical protein
MAKDELHHKNYIRICVINWLLTPVLMFFFSWPYFKMGQMLHLDSSLALLGSIVFGFSFMLTILHGHVSVAIGNLHRGLYYEWLESHPYSYGIMFHKGMTTTRFRISLILIAITILIFGSLIEL